MRPIAREVRFGYGLARISLGSVIMGVITVDVVMAEAITVLHIA